MIQALDVTCRSGVVRHFPAMTLVEVKIIFDGEALVEIEATAVQESRS